MDYAILWIACLAMNLLFVAAVSSFSAHHKSIWLAEVWPRWVFWLGFLMNLFPFILACVLMKHNIRPSWLFPYILSLMICYVVGGRFILHKGLKKTEERFKAREWPQATLSISFGIVLCIFILTLHIMNSNIGGDRSRILTRTTGQAIYVLPAKVPDSLDAGRDYDEAHRLLTEKDIPELFVRYSINPDFNPDLKEAADFIKKNQDTLDIIKKAVNKPAINVDVNPANLMLSPIPQFSIYRAMARLLSLSAKVKAHKGDPGAALEDLEMMEKISTHLYEMKTLISQMIAIAIDGMRKSTLEYILSMEQSPGKAEFAKPVKPAFSIMPYFRDSIRLEHISMRQALVSADYRIVPDTSGDLEIKSAFLSRAAFMLYNIFLFQDDIQSLNNFQAQLDDAFEGPFHDRIKAMDDLEKNFFKDQDIGLFSRIMIPNFSAYYIRVGRMIAGRNQMELALAAASYKADNGKYPESLEALVPDYIESVPEDPFDGKPMKLKVMDGGLDIYSVGEDENLRYSRGEVHFYLGPGPYNEYRHQPAVEKAKK
jgi:hypothetical protein